MTESEDNKQPTIIALRETSGVRGRPEVLRWGACIAAALFIHVAGAVALLARWNDPADAVANAPVILVELAQVPVAPDVTPNELPPGRQQADAQAEPDQPKPIEKIEIKTES